MDIKGVDAGRYQFSSDKQPTSPPKSDIQDQQVSTDSVIVALSASSGQLAQLASSGDKPIEGDTQYKAQKVDIEI